MDTHPLCFSSRADYERWLDSREPKDYLGAEHCTDCMPSFKARMQDCGRCEHPETRFKLVLETGFQMADVGLSIRGTWRELRQPKVAREVVKKPVAKVRRTTMHERIESSRANYWREQERIMRERLSR